MVEKDGQGGDTTTYSENIGLMLVSLCGLVEGSYDPEMIRRVDGLSEWWMKEKAQQKVQHGPRGKEGERMKRHYAKLLGDLERCDPDKF